MAERRMFSKTIIDSDAFLDMPATTQNLYFHLAMRADDDGFVNNPKKIQRISTAGDDDLRLLCAKSFIIPFESGIIVIKHWRICNYLRSDRYKPTVYRDEMNQLEVKENGAYTLKSGIPTGIPKVYQRETQYSIGKGRVGEDNNMGCPTSPKPESKRFTKPSLEEVKSYCLERHNSVNPEKFIDHYESVGWRIGNKPMKNWQAAVRTWEKNNYDQPNLKVNQRSTFLDMKE